MKTLNIIESIDGEVVDVGFLTYQTDFKREFSWVLNETDFENYQHLEGKAVYLTDITIFSDYRYNGYGKKAIIRFSESLKEQGYSYLLGIPYPKDPEWAEMDLGGYMEYLNTFYADLGFEHLWKTKTKLLETENLLSVFLKKLQN